jgi:hypothetical protein
VDLIFYYKIANDENGENSELERKKNISQKPSFGTALEFFAYYRDRFERRNKKSRVDSGKKAHEKYQADKEKQGWRIRAQISFHQSIE